MRAVLRTLAQCHAHHILHRDIKPGRRAGRRCGPKVTKANARAALYLGGQGGMHACGARGPPPPAAPHPPALPELCLVQLQLALHPRARKQLREPTTPTIKTHAALQLARLAPPRPPLLPARICPLALAPAGCALAIAGNFMLLSGDDRAPLKAIDFGLAAPFDPACLPRTDLGLEVRCAALRQARGSRPCVDWPTGGVFFRLGWDGWHFPGFSGVCARAKVGWCGGGGAEGTAPAATMPRPACLPARPPKHPPTTHTHTPPGAGHPLVHGPRDAALRGAARL